MIKYCQAAVPSTVCELFSERGGGWNIYSKGEMVGIVLP